MTTDEIDAALARHMGWSHDPDSPWPGWIHAEGHVQPFTPAYSYSLDLVADVERRLLAEGGFPLYGRALCEAVGHVPSEPEAPQYYGAIALVASADAETRARVLVQVLGLEGTPA